jgi:hypothetical protein
MRLLGKGLLLLVRRPDSASGDPTGDVISS